MALTIHFTGLCAFCPTTNAGGAGDVAGIRVVMVPGHGEHIPTLSLPLVKVQSEDDAPIDFNATDWTPDLVSYSIGKDQHNQAYLMQVAHWQLRGRTVRMEGQAEQVSWPDAATTFAFRDFHQAEVRNLPDVVHDYPATGIVEISRGELRSSDVEEHDVSHGAKPAVPRNLARSVTLKTSALVLVREDGKRIVFRDGSEGIISNVAPIAGNNNSHFHHYYDVVSRPPGEPPVTIADKHYPYYDCVPPAQP